MSLEKFSYLLQKSNAASNDKKWFPKWIRSYSSFLNNRPDLIATRSAPNDSTKLPSRETPINPRLTITSQSAIEFSRSLLKTRQPAWIRLQAMRALDSYRTLVLKADQPDLLNIRNTLSRIAAQESATGCDPSEPIDESEIVGQISEDQPEIIQRLQRELRLHFKALNTERAYIKNINQFIDYLGSSDLEKFGEPEIRAFLTHRAVEQNVAPNTQNQAKSALLFLYQNVIGRQLEFIDYVPSDKEQRLPVVLSRNEVNCSATIRSTLRVASLEKVTQKFSLASGSGTGVRFALPSSEPAVGRST